MPLRSSTRSPLPLENLCLGRRDRIRVDEALQRSGPRRPEKEASTRASGGPKKQRLAIAAALALKPQVLSWTNLLPSSIRWARPRCLPWCRALNRELGMTVVLASHQSEEVAEFADRVALWPQVGSLGWRRALASFRRSSSWPNTRCDRPRSLSFFTASGNAGSRWTLCRLLWQKRYPLTRRCAHA